MKNSKLITNLDKFYKILLCANWLMADALKEFNQSEFFNFHITFGAQKVREKNGRLNLGFYT